MAQSLKDKVAIVTGSSSGLGQAIAVMFASRGAKVTLCGRNEDRLRSVLNQAVKVSGGHGDRFLTVNGDLTEKSVQNEIVARTVENFGRLDILVANAGLSNENCSLLDATEQSYDNIMNANVKSVFFLIQKSLPRLEQTKGTIVIVSSVASTIATGKAAIYAMSKAAVDHLIRCLAVDLGPKGIRVNSVNPGFIPTRILRYLEGDMEEITQRRVEFERGRIALSLRAGTPEDVAEAVTFLASDSAAFITGENVKIDAGRSFGGSY